MAKILVVDDDRAVRESLQRALQLADHEVALAEDGMAGIAHLQRAHVDAVVLDVMMPGVDGFGLLRRIRQDGNDVPVLLLTARDAVEDRVTGLDVGADDYLAKPFALDELLARLRALLRRSGADGRVASTRVAHADLLLDPEAMQAWRGDRELDLTRTEFELLHALLDNAPRVLNRSVLHDRVWGYDASLASNTLEVYIGYLRRKLEADGESRLVQTVRGVGYVLRED